MPYKINTSNTAQYNLCKTSGENYEAVRMLRLKFAGTTAEEKFSILHEFKLLDEYREIEALKERKKVFEKAANEIKSNLQLTNLTKLKNKNGSKDELLKSLESLNSEIKIIDEKLADKDTETISVKDYYEKLVTILFEGSPKVEFNNIDIAVVNSSYNDFFLMLNGKSNSMTAT